MQSRRSAGLKARLDHSMIPSTSKRGTKLNPPSFEEIEMCDKTVCGFQSVSLMLICCLCAHL